MENLDFLLSSSSEARITGSPHGRSPGPAPFNSASVSPPAALDSLSAEQLQQIGLSLYNAVTADPGLRDLFIANFTSDSRDGLRLRLQIEPPEMRRWPWEGLYRDPSGFLALNAISITRYIAVGVQQSRPMVTQLPLRILLASAAPADLPALDFAAERKNLEDALADESAKGWISLEFLEHAKRDTLREALTQFRPHVLHFSGHGKFKEDQSALAFEDPYGDTDSVTPEAVAILFGGLADLRLIVLNACETAIDSTTQPLTGIAPKILGRTGIPAVVAMQAPILDKAAIAFTRAFYNQLASGQTIDDAMREGRLAIYNATSASATFVIPVLFLSADEGLLVDFPQQRRERVVENARRGLDAVRAGPDTDSTTQTLTKWQVQLTAAAQIYKNLAAWKSLHDLLHELNESLEFILLELPRLDKAAPDLNYVAEYFARCQTTFSRLTDFARTGAAPITVQSFKESNGGYSGDPWLVEPLAGERAFDAALNEGSYKAVSGAARKLRQTIQTHMNAADKSLEDKTADLRRVAARWADPDELPSGTDLAKAITELDRLHTTLYTAVEKHDIFQNLDNDFARLRDESRRPTWEWEAVSAAWEFCRSDVLDSLFIPFAKKLGQLTVGGDTLSGAEWCVDIVRLSNALDAQINAEEMTAVRNTLRQLGTAIRTHFFIADKELKDLTTTLDALSDDLLDILKVNPT